ncbi:SMI1/KNR4 family protein [Flavobacterium sp. C4GT6]|uniref:SMI1/KNR4 family protein n=1 Tax=Flavobacterium sp. C4GT6 TaxID=3103818 RepID=UPI002ED27240
MKIEYLKELELNPYRHGDPDMNNDPISLTEIENLERLYNNGKPFPKALKELLFLAGKYCYVLEYGAFDSQQEIQDYVRELLEEDNISIQRPFFVIDVYNAGSQFLYVYLDEGNNPAVYEGFHYFEINFNGYSHLTSSSLQKFIESQIGAVKQGGNAF